MEKSNVPPKSSMNSLAGKFLLAMPGMGDPRFHKAVVLVCAHDDNGAMGLVINNTLPGIGMAALLKQLNIVADNPAAEDSALDIPVMNGGPVENARGFILHSSEFRQADTIRISEDISVTGTIDALRAVAAGNGPKEMIFILGYSGWTAGQLDQEIQDNAWLVFDADPAVIFDTRAEQKWDAVIRKMGIDPAMLSSNMGRA